MTKYKGKEDIIKYKENKEPRLWKMSYNYSRRERNKYNKKCKK